jgi:hypothetical protein
VSPTGSDSNPGTQAQPFRTIQKAANTVNPGDTVIVENGVYTYSGSNPCGRTVVCLTRGGVSGRLVTFRSRNKWGAKIDGQNTAGAGFGFGGANYVRIQDFEVYGVANAGGSASGVEVLDGGRFSEIIGNRIHNIGRVCTDTANGQAAIYIKQNNVLIEGNTIHDVGRLTPGQNGCSPSNNYYQNHDHGVYHSAGDDITVRNNIIYNVKQGWAIHAYPNARARMNILNNTIAFSSQYSGKLGAIIIYDGDVSDSNISNNIFYQVSTAAIYIGGSGTSFSNVRIGNNIVSNGTILYTASGIDISGISGLSTNRTNADPEMVNPAGFDFHLRGDSLAIDSGVTVPVPTDFEGRRRPQGAGFDVGAYEYSSSSVSLLRTPKSMAKSVFVKQAHVLNARPAEAIPRESEKQAFKAEGLRFQPDVPGGFNISGPQAVPFRPGLFIPEDQRMGRRLADQRQIVFAVGGEGWAFPLIAVEDYPHISLAADQARDRPFVRAEPMEHLVDGPRVAREFPAVYVKN